MLFPGLAKFGKSEEVTGQLCLEHNFPHVPALLVTPTGEGLSKSETFASVCCHRPSPAEVTVADPSVLKFSELIETEQR